MSFPGDIVGSPMMGPNNFTPPSSSHGNLAQAKRKAEASVADCFQQLAIKISPPPKKLGLPVSDVTKIRRGTLAFGDPDTLPVLRLAQEKEMHGPSLLPLSRRCSFTLGASLETLKPSLPLARESNLLPELPQFDLNQGLSTSARSDTLSTDLSAAEEPEKENISPPTVFRFLQQQNP